MHEAQVAQGCYLALDKLAAGRNGSNAAQAGVFGNDGVDVTAVCERNEV